MASPTKGAVRRWDGESISPAISGRGIGDAPRFSISPRRYRRSLPGMIWPDAIEHISRSSSSGSRPTGYRSTDHRGPAPDASDRRRGDCSVDGRIGERSPEERPSAFRGRLRPTPPGRRLHPWPYGRCDAPAPTTRSHPRPRRDDRTRATSAMDPIASDAWNPSTAPPPSEPSSVSSPFGQ